MTGNSITNHSSNGQWAAPPSYEEIQDQPPTYNSISFQQGQQTVIVHQPNSRNNRTSKFDRAPATLICPHCEANVISSTSRKCGFLVWIACGIICFAGLVVLPLFWLGCCLIPFCIPALYDVEHKCPNCTKVLGKYEAANGIF